MNNLRLNSKSLLHVFLRMFLNRVGDHPKQFQFELRRIEAHRPSELSRARSPVPTSYHHRRVSSNSSHPVPFQNAATSYSKYLFDDIPYFLDRPQDRGYRRPEDKGKFCRKWKDSLFT